ncbi:Acetyltransferase (GNAT) family protein [Neorhodopirellula lusitana]|uniref:Acetyltransferase (GNAT) family protein n=1 Tax=Neorhodopirellula lusitana TaxID=445327 RepID=A0ABY1QNB0_9BACT|nr:GNAT family N-acetyltransferase [Neorhodopirellula lusitana]SMP76069.1 Acetyltransferase (GNAT) family protein [Neorhodopirellula lusitana]
MSATVFHLEMLDRDSFEPVAMPAGWTMSVVHPAQPSLNLRFYRDVGGHWNWTDRLAWSDELWRDYVNREALRTWVGRLDGEAVGYFELEAQESGNVEIAIFGLLPNFIGRGLGAVLLSAAIEAAWAIPGTRRVWVHTCTDDHEHALANYQKRGFRLFQTDASPPK